MIQEFLQQQNRDRLILFFSGWGTDARSFAGLSHPTADVAICYDYTDPGFDARFYARYRSITAVAWSMGVFAAAEALRGCALPVKQRIAVNGTEMPIDDERGIPGAIFQGTLEGLNEITLRKFYRRMCGSAEGFARFSERLPNRSPKSLKAELAAIGRRSAEPAVSLPWERVIVGRNDRIFPFDNQLRSWAGNTGIEITDDAHWLPFEPLIEAL